jgi:streptogramin lyase
MKQGSQEEMITAGRKNTIRLLSKHRHPGIPACIMLLTLFMGCELINTPPVIDIVVEDETPLAGSTQTLTAVVEDLDEDPVVVTWSASAGTFSKIKGETVKWTAPLVIQDVVVTATADDRKAGGEDSVSITLSVVNEAPSISSFESSQTYVNLGNTINLTADAFDPDGEDIVYDFFTSPLGAGSFAPRNPEDNTVDWTAPVDATFARTYDLIVKVIDEQNYFSTDTLEVLVYSEYGTIWIVDSVKRKVSKYTTRGEKILSSSYNFDKPVAVANNIDEFFGCYVADHDAGEIVKLDAKGEMMTTFTDIPNVTDLAIHYGTGTLWAISVSDDDPRLTIIDTYTESEIARVKGFSRPAAITINQNRGDVWIEDVGENDRIIQIEVNEFLSAPLDTLSSAFAATFDGNFDFDRSSTPGLSILDAQTATLYFTDTNDDEVERLTYSGATDSYLRGVPVAFDTGVNPRQVAVTLSGEVWVLSLEGTVQYFQETNTTQRTPIFSYFFTDPSIMVADRTTSNVWVADNGTHQVVEVSSVDSIGVRISGFEFVEDLVINK